MIIPDQINEPLREILGFMLWDSHEIAVLMRADGVEIPPKCEEEQAYALHKMLWFYAEYGLTWKSHMRDWMQGVMDQARKARGKTE